MNVGSRLSGMKIVFSQRRRGRDSVIEEYKYMKWSKNGKDTGIKTYLQSTGVQSRIDKSPSFSLI